MPLDTVGTTLTWKGWPMDADHFDSLARSLTTTRSRRHALAAALAGGLGTLGLGTTEAKKKRRKKKNDGGRNGDGKKGGSPQSPPPQSSPPPPSCTPETPVATCAGRCGTWPNTCGEFVTCPSCTDGKQCVGNGSCAITCSSTPECPAGCGCSFPTAEGGQRCIATPVPCPTQPCQNTTDCPFGQQCQTCNGDRVTGCPQCETDPGLPTPKFCFRLCGS